MNFTDFLLTIPMLVNLYAEKYRQDDKGLTMLELAAELNVPKVQEYDFIVGKCIKFPSTKHIKCPS